MYSDLIVKHFTEPSFVGDLEANDFEYEIGNSVCGDRIRVQLKTDQKRIDKIAFRAWGCATSVATADIFCQNVVGKTADELLACSEEELASLLGELEPSQRHCINILHELHSTLIKEMEVEQV